MIEGKIPSPYDVAWIDFVHAEERRTTEIARDAAKAILQFYGVSSSLYSGVIVIASREREISTVPLFFWAAGLFLALVGLLPIPWFTFSDYPTAVRREFRRIAHIRAAFVWMAAGVGAIGFAMAAASIARSMP